MTGTRQTFALRAHVAVLIACALLARAMVPAGWMPAEGHGFRVQLCAEWSDGGSGARFQAEARRLVDQALAGTARHGERGKSSAPDQPCAFAGLAMAAIAPDGVVPMPPALAVEPLPPPSLTAAIGRGLAAPPPPSTGPPARA